MMNSRWQRAGVVQRSLVAGLSAACLLATTVAVADDARSGQAEAQQLLAQLRQSTGVVPPAPPVHPTRALYNREAVVPPQCYTRTEGRFNPCYVCHQDAIPGRENVMNDRELQIAYSFSDIGQTNHWQNLFEDRSARVAAIGDAEIIEWVNRDNYSALAPRHRW